MSSGIQIPIGGDLAPFLTAVNQLRHEVSGMSRQVTDGMKPISSAAQRAGKDFRELGQTGAAAAGHMKSAWGGLGNLIPQGGLIGALGSAGTTSNAGLSSKAIMAGMGGLGGLGGMAAAASGAVAPFLALGGAAKGALAVLDQYAEFDSLSRGLQTLEGTAEATAARLETLRDVAKSPGLGFEEAVRGDVRLRSAGLSATLSEKALRAFGNAIATVGGGKEQLDGVLLALSQISAKGKVSAEEINQLNERLPQIRTAMKEAFGTSDTEMLGKKGITSAKFIEDITAQFAKLPPVAGGARNAIDNFQDSLKSLKVAGSGFFAGSAEGFIKDLSGAATLGRKILEGRTADGAADARVLKHFEDIAKEKQAKEDAAKAEQDTAKANDAFWADLHNQGVERARERAAKEQEIERSNLEKIAALRESAYAITLGKEADLRRRIANLEAGGPLGTAAMEGANSERQLEIAEKSLELLRLKKELSETLAADEKKKDAADAKELRSLSSPVVLTTALGRIGGGGFGMTFMPMLGEQKIANGHLARQTHLLAKIENKIEQPRAIV
jgi:tape measure domain-containing protein